MTRAAAFAVRGALLDDAGAIEGLRVACWRAAYRGLVPDAFLDSMTVDGERRRAVMAERAGACGEWVACARGEVVGWAVAGPCRDPDRARADCGEIYACYVRPGWWGGGVGRRLMTGAVAALRGAGRPDITLWVLEGNVRARRFYERCGFLPDGARKALELGGPPAMEIRCRRLPGSAGR